MYLYSNLYLSNVSLIHVSASVILLSGSNSQASLFSSEGSSQVISSCVVKKCLKLFTIMLYF